MAEPLAVTLETPERLTIAIAGDLDKEALPALEAAIAAGRKTIKEAYANNGRQMRVLLDMSGFTGRYDVEAMEAMAAFARGNADYIERTAAFGGPDRGEAAGEIVAALAGRENIEFFKNKEEAVAWLGQ